MDHYTGIRSRAGDPYCQVQTRLAWARSLLARGERERALALAQQAASAAKTHRFATLARRATAVVTEARGA